MAALVVATTPLVEVIVDSQSLLLLQSHFSTSKSLSKSESDCSEQLESQLFRIAAAASAVTLDLQRLREAITSTQDRLKKV